MSQPNLTIPVFVARGIDADSWLNEPHHEWFRDGYAYAATQTRAISALSKCTAEEVEAVVWAVMRGAGLGDPGELPRARWRGEGPPPAAAETERLEKSGAFGYVIERDPRDAMVAGRFSPGAPMFTWFESEAESWKASGWKVTPVFARPGGADDSGRTAGGGRGALGTGDSQGGDTP